MSGRKRARVLHALAHTAVCLLVLLLLTPVCDAESLKSKVKMKRSNPVIRVLVDGKSERLILTTGRLVSRAVA